MGCRIMNGVTKQCTARLRLTLETLNIEQMSKVNLKLCRRNRYYNSTRIKEEAVIESDLISKHTEVTEVSETSVSNMAYHIMHKQYD